MIRTLVAGAVLCLAASTAALERNPMYPWAARAAVHWRKWGSPIAIAAFDDVDGEPALLDIQGIVRFSLLWTSSEGHQLPAELRVHERTGAISGTPTINCIGICQQNYTLSVYASDNTTTGVLIERFELVIDNWSSTGELPDSSADDGDDLMPIYIAVAATVTVLAITVLLTVYYLVKRKQTTEQEPIPTIPKQLHIDAQSRRSSDSDFESPQSPIGHLDITDEPVPGTVSLHNGAYLDIGPSIEYDSPQRLTEPSDEEQPWYAANSRRTQCEQDVAAAEHGDFLVRKSRGSDMYVLVVNDHGSPTSFPVTKIIDDDGVDKFVFGAKLFDNIRGLIKYLRIHPLTGKDGSTLQLQSAASINDEIASTSLMSDISCASGMSAAGSSVWFVGPVRRSVVEASVVAAGHGDYLVRESSKGTHYVLCINDHGIPLSYQIQREGVAFIFSDRAFRSMGSLIEYLRSSPLMGAQGEPISLRKPAPLLKDRGKSAVV